MDLARFPGYRSSRDQFLRLVLRLACLCCGPQAPCGCAREQRIFEQHKQAPSPAGFPRRRFGARRHRCCCHQCGSGVISVLLSFLNFYLRYLFIFCFIWLKYVCTICFTRALLLLFCFQDDVSIEGQPHPVGKSEATAAASESQALAATTTPVGANARNIVA